MLLIHEVYSFLIINRQLSPEGWTGSTWGDPSRRCINILSTKLTTFESDRASLLRRSMPLTNLKKMPVDFQYQPIFNPIICDSFLRYEVRN